MKKLVMMTAAIVVLVATMRFETDAATITLTEGTKYQTIEGFGAFASISPWRYRSGPFYLNINLDSVGFYDSMVTELGATLWRTGIPGAEFQPSAGTFNRGASGVTEWLNTIRKLSNAAVRHGEPVRFFSSIWSPPSWMKVIGSEGCVIEAAPQLHQTDCKLIVGMETNLGNHFAEWTRVIRDSTGVDLYGLSLQNEPAFSQPFSSCVYDGPRYRDVLKIVAPIVRAAAPDIRFIGTEHMSWAFPNHFENHIRDDATALGYMHAWAVHGYRDGVIADTGAYQGSTPTDKVFWMTETSGTGYGEGLNAWSGAMNLANSILGYLRNTKMTAWTWWRLQHVTSEDPNTASGWEDLIISGSKTAKYYASSHFYRFIRPGARQIASTSSDGQLKIVAFRHEEDNCWTVVVHNNNASAKTVDIAGSNTPGTWEVHTSTSAEKRVATSSGRNGIPIPAYSLVTLVSGTYRGTGTAVSPRQPAMRSTGGSRASATVTASVYTLDGRLLQTAQDSEYIRGLAPGIYRVVTRNGNGVTLRGEIRAVR